MLKQHSTVSAVVMYEFPIHSDSGVPCSVRHVKTCVKADAHPCIRPVFQLLRAETRAAVHMALQPFPHRGMSELGMCSRFSCSACDCQLC